MSAAIARAFVNAITSRNADEIGRLMTEDHVFIDSMGTRVAGREQMRKGWQGYFGMAPDYAISVEETFEEGAVVVMLGDAVVRGETIAEWRVYADNEPVRRLMASSRPS